MADVYSFTTQVKDDYLPRVADEAPEDSNVIIVKEVSTTGLVARRTTNFYLLVKRDFFNRVANLYPNHKFLKMPIGEILMFAENTPVAGINGSDYYIFERYGVSKADLVKTEVNLRNEVNRLNNLAKDRIVKVTVETL